MSEEVMLSGRVPEELKKLVDADPRTNQEIIQAALWKEFGGKRQSVVEQQIDHKQEQLKSIRDEKADLTDAAADLETEIRALKERLAELDNDSNELNNDMDEILDAMEEKGTHYWADNPNIKELATEYGLDESDIMHRLKHRAKDQGRELWTHQFHRKDLVEHSDMENRLITEVDDVDGA